MGRLASFSADEVIRKLRRAGFVFDRQAKGSHEIWWNPQTHLRTSMSHHCDNLPEETAEAILRQVRLSMEELLGL
ncbi:MAG: type II toxin-antitoxin system HicA family toxin [Dehalococcoidia bacterium]|nr:type II toxin-antitoxin system HicA family toxin [Dehalococcoidia bacterium]